MKPVTDAMLIAVVVGATLVVFAPVAVALAVLALEGM